MRGSVSGKGGYRVVIVSKPKKAHDTLTVDQSKELLNQIVKKSYTGISLNLSEIGTNSPF